jgi:hypothetical protein
MEPQKVSEIEKIIKNNLEEETRKSIDDLTSSMAIATQQAVDRINGVYGSALKTLKELELTDATIFDFFQKTNGKIRVIEINNKWRTDLQLNMSGNTMDLTNAIQLQGKTTYKIILMVIEVKKETPEIHDQPDTNN